MKFEFQINNEYFLVQVCAMQYLGYKKLFVYLKFSGLYLH